MTATVLLMLPAQAVAQAGVAQAAPVQSVTAAEGLCRPIAASLAAHPGTGPVFLQSYLAAPGEDDLPGALRNAAFVYDNALAAIALVGCGEVEAARRIADGLVRAQGTDRFYRDGRIRNAYRSGPLDVEGASPAGGVALAGWWDETSARWQEDAYQASTAVGNVAWAALALLHVHEATDDARYLESARALMRWVEAHASDAASPAGYTGGDYGFEPAAGPIDWKSTEHNIDVMAVAAWLAEHGEEAETWTAMAARAKGFVTAMRADGQGFQIGTTPQNAPAGFADLVLDAQIWPAIAVAEPPEEWLEGLDVAMDRLSVPGGFDFNSDRDGLWTEGTAQAALVFDLRQDAGAGRPFLDAALDQLDPATGYLMATREKTVSTGLSIGPSGGDAFTYFRRPHLGATAWAALAALSLNPFLPQEPVLPKGQFLPKGESR